MISTSWTIISDQAKPGTTHMGIDQAALFSDGEIKPTLRFFRWSEKTISYGYLLDLFKVQQWARAQAPNENLPLVQRPTGGGAVLHTPQDLSISVLWPRGFKLLPEKPRDCYEVIHDVFRRSVIEAWKLKEIDLYVKPDGSCATEPAVEPSADGRFSVCFQEPVCNDVMLKGNKVIGGALRLTKKAILYQGTIQGGPTTSLDLLTESILKAFSSASFQRGSVSPASSIHSSDL